MARRRMFSLDVIDTDSFLDLPASSQSLYFHLGMRADDDGFVSSPKRITAMVCASSDDLKLLVAKGFVIPFESGVCVIRDWRSNNYIQRDRYTPTIYAEEKKSLSVDAAGRYNLTDAFVDFRYIYEDIFKTKDLNLTFWEDFSSAIYKIVPTHIARKGAPLYIDPSIK